MASDPVPGGFASWSDLFAVQQRLNRAADEIAASCPWWRLVG